MNLINFISFGWIPVILFIMTVHVIRQLNPQQDAQISSDVHFIIVIYVKLKLIL